MADHDDHERIARKAYEIWESEGHPHGREQSHWDQAKEIVALHDSMGDTLLPRDAGAFEPEEPTQAVEAYGDVPGLTDQGRNDLVDTAREPEITKAPQATPATGDTAGHVARAKRDEGPGIDDRATVTPAAKVAPVTPTPANPTLGTPAPRDVAKPTPGLPPIAKGAGAPMPSGNGAPVTGKSPPKPATPPAPVTKGRR